MTGSADPHGSLDEGDIFARDKPGFAFIEGSYTGRHPGVQHCEADWAVLAGVHADIAGQQMRCSRILGLEPSGHARTIAKRRETSRSTNASGNGSTRLPVPRRSTSVAR